MDISLYCLPCLALFLRVSDRPWARRLTLTALMEKNMHNKLSLQNRRRFLRCVSARDPQYHPIQFFDLRGRNCSYQRRK
jgi:hypothetical protein